MFVGELFRRVLDRFDAGLNVLDLCAAPGGKTTDLAASLRERFVDRYSLIANEVMRNRFGVLRSNVRTWGDPRVGVVSRDPSAFTGKTVFDIIVTDVPCSGEGMFRKDEKAVEDWSPEAVDFCAARSRRILSDVWSALKPGGILFLSVKEGIKTGPDEKGRYMHNYTEQELRTKLETAGFEIMETDTSEDSLGRSGFRWLNVFARNHNQ
jgi:hypothetical protein